MDVFFGDCNNSAITKTLPASESLSGWYLWCRLCSKENAHINVQQLSESESILMSAIKKHFSVDIARDNEQPKILCTNCSSFVIKLVSFTERVKKVQKMFCKLKNIEDDVNMDLHAVRLKFGLLDEDCEPVFMSEAPSFETKAKHNDRQETICETESLRIPSDPLKIEIKEEISECTQQQQHAEFETSLIKEENVSDIEVEREVPQQEKVTSILQQNSRKRKSSRHREQSKGRQNKGLSDKKSVGNKISDTSDDAVISEFHAMTSTIATSERPFKCSECQVNFKLIHLYRQHMRDVHSKLPEFRCGQCECAYYTQDELNVHGKVHIPVHLRKVLPCPYCEKKLCSEALVQAHIKNMHLNERPYVCDKCGFGQLTESALRVHMLTHTNYAPFECQVCHKSFKDNSRLRNHMDTHNPRKYVCPECGLELNSRVTLNRHLVVHSDQMQHKCDYCGRAFKRTKSLKSHLILHTGLKPYSCDFCDQTFASGANCRKHKRQVHPEELAALDAAGGSKRYTQNIPNLAELKAVTRVADDLTPVVSKRSGCFAFSKKSKIRTAI